MHNVKNDLILLHGSFSHAKTAGAFFGKPWVFFDRDYSDRMRWEKALGSELRVDYKEELTGVSYALRDEFVEWSGRLGRPHWDKWYWWITGLATRNNVTSKLYLYICYIEVLKRIFEKNRAGLVVISNSWELLGVIESGWKDKANIIKPFYFEGLCGRVLYYFKEKARFILSWIGFFRKSIFEWAIARYTRLRCARKPEYVYDKNHVVIHSCVDDECIGDDGEFKNRYFPGLAKYLSGMGMRVSILTWAYNIKKKTYGQALRWFRENKEQFLIPQDYYNPIDCLRSFFVILRSSKFKFLKKDCIFRGVNIKPLINAEQMLQAGDTGTAYFINQMRIFYRWKKLGYGLKAYVDTWELKNCEVPALTAIKQNFPLCKTVAYQHGALIPKLFFFNYKTTPEEFDASIHADIGIANSEITRKFLSEEGFPRAFIKLGPALRYKWLEKYASSPSPAGKDGVLVCLSLSMDISHEMMEIIYEALASADFKIAIKPHPMMDLSAFKKSLSFSWPDNFTLVSGSMEEWIKRTKIAIVTQSSSMVETVFLKMKTIIISRPTDIDIIPLDIIKNNKPWRIADNARELVRAVKDLYNNGSEEGIETKDLFAFDMKLLDEVFR